MATCNRLHGWLLLLLYIINVLTSSTQCEPWGYILIA
jgi:hypothetical protein